MLDMDGICASAGSACTSGQSEPSHVLTAIGVEEERARGALRLTLSGNTTREDIDYVVEKIKKNVSDLREKSTAYQEYKNARGMQGNKRQDKIMLDGKAGVKYTENK